MPLREICVAIAKYAFVTSPYPVVISAEVHCGVSQQEKMAKVMTEVFGDALVRGPEEGAHKVDVLPSPEALKGRVLLKVIFFVVPSENGLVTSPTILIGQEPLPHVSSRSCGTKQKGTHPWKAAQTRSGARILRFILLRF